MWEKQDTKHAGRLLRGSTYMYILIFKILILQPTNTCKEVKVMVHPYRFSIWMTLMTETTTNSGVKV